MTLAPSEMAAADSLASSRTNFGVVDGGAGVVEVFVAVVVVDDVFVITAFVVDIAAVLGVVL